MRFLVDAQLPPALARWLAGQGHQAEHVADIGMVSASDRAIWDYATLSSALIVTKDEDFAVGRALVDDGPQIVWLRVGNTRRRVLLAWFAGIFPQVVAAIERVWRIVEMRAP